MNWETVALSSQPRTTNNGHGLFTRKGGPRNFVMFAPRPFVSDDSLMITVMLMGSDAGRLKENHIIRDRQAANGHAVSVSCNPKKPLQAAKCTYP